MNFDKLANFFAKQKLALEATKAYKYTLYGGTKGSGKSRFLRFAALYWVIKYFKKYGLKGVNACIFCEDYPALEDRHLKKVRVEFPSWLGEYNASRRDFIVSEDYGGGIISFRNLDDPSKYESAEFAVILIDELQRNPFSTFNTLRTRMRWPGIPDCKFIAAAIPGGESYVAQYWIDRLFPPEEKEAEQFFFVKALPGDNPYLPAEYHLSLESLSEAEQRAYIDSDFHAFDDITDDKGWIKLISPTKLAELEMDILAHSGTCVFGVDVGAGGDESVVVKRTRTMAQVLYKAKLADTMKLVPIILELAKTHKPISIGIDIIGVGKGVYDRLCELREFNGRNIVQGVNAAAQPTEKKADTKQFGAKLYLNLRAELYDKTLEWLTRHNGRLYRHVLDTDGHKKPAGWNELTIVKYSFDSDRVMRIQSKEEMRKKNIKSPNVADALMLSMIADDQTIAILEEVHKRRADDELFGTVQKPEFGFVD